MEEMLDDYTKAARKDWVFALASLVAGLAFAALVIYLAGSFTAGTFDIRQWTGGSRTGAMIVWIVLGPTASVISIITWSILLEARDEIDRDARAAWMDRQMASAKPDIRAERPNGRRIIV